MESYKELKDNQENPNVIEVDLITGCFYNGIKRMVKSTFHQFYEDILERIAEDYGIDLDELKENYPMEIKTHKRKPRDPTKCCIATIKKTGLQCSNLKREGYDYCGVHIKTAVAQATMGVTYDEDTKIVPTYAPREESRSEVRRRLRMAERDKEYEVKEEIFPEEILGEDDEDIDVTNRKINGKDYLICQNNVYICPKDGIEELDLVDLEFTGLIQEDGTIKWK